MDFIGGFQKVNGFGNVLVMVEKFSKYSIFIEALNEFLVEETIRPFFRNVVNQFRGPKDIVSDKDTWFIGRFLVELLKMLGIECYFSS